MTETHPLLPSGDWTGFYTYASGPGASRCTMPCFLNFSAGIVNGGGTDEVGSFSWSGTYDLNTLTCALTKSYTTHDVQYRGHIDENGIWGNWVLTFRSGGFHLWPKEEQMEEEMIEIEAMSGPSNFLQMSNRTIV